jgi:capsule polysaccharide export protein KpsE/RkpR
MASGPGSRDALTVRDYALSRDMLARLDKEHAIIAHYKSPWVDWFSRLRQSASFEDAYEYFGDKISADYDSTSGAVNLRVRAFSAEKAAEFSSAILDYSEEKVNSLTQRERRDVLQYAESEFARAEIRLTKIKMDIVSLRQKRGDLSFDGGLLRAAQDVLKAPAPATKPAKGFDAALVEIEAKKVEKELADKAYASALTALENARADADRKHRYLAVVAGPSKPDVSKYPRRLLGVVNAGVVSFLLMGIATLIVAAVREHARL